MAAVLYYAKAHDELPGQEIEIRFVEEMLRIGDNESTGRVTWCAERPLIELVPFELLIGSLASESDEEHTFAHELAHIILQHDLRTKSSSSIDDLIVESNAEGKAWELCEKWHFNDDNT